MFTEEKKNSQIFQDSNHLSPTSELEVSELIKEAYKKKFPIDIHGSNSKKFIGYNVQAAKNLDFSSLSGVIEYLPEELYIKVKPGTLIKDIENILEKIIKNFHLSQLILVTLKMENQIKNSPVDVFLAILQLRD